MSECDENIRQSHIFSCAIKCQQLILCDYGIYVPESKLLEIAMCNGWFENDSGTYMRYNGCLLGCFGIDYYHKQNATVVDIENEIALQHRVMVSVNKYKLSGLTTSHPDASHAVLINDINNESVFITDTALGCFSKRYRLNDFIKAWKDSVFYMLATYHPAEYVYNPREHKMNKLNINTYKS